MSSLNETIKSLGPARVAVLGATFLSLIIFFIFVSSKVSQPSMSIVYRDLTPTDSAQISAKLEETGILYTISADGTQVFVPQPDVGRARMLLAEEGLPNGGSMGFEIFDKQTGFGTTSFIQNINQVRAMQGELGRTISSLDPVQYAKVHIVLPQRELFSRETQMATASVTLKLKGNRRLSRDQIYAIQNIVANSVPDLKADSVSIIDTDANLLAGGDSESATGGLTGLKAEELRLSYERRLVQSIESLVGRTVGLNKVRASVTADLDFDRISTNDEIYDPEGQVVRSTQSVTEDNVQRDAQNNESVSVANNLPGLGDMGSESQASSEVNRTEEVTNFEISKTIRSTVKESGEVTKLSVAVLVDGRYTTSEDGTRTYEPRSQQELDQIATLVKSAVGFDAQRGDSLEVVNMPFAEIEIDTAETTEKLFGFEKTQVLSTVEMIMLGIMGILVILLVVRPLVGTVVMSQKASIEAAKQEAALLAAETAPAALAAPSAYASSSEDDGEAFSDGQADTSSNAALDMQSVEGKVNMSSAKKVGDIVNSHPNETVSVIRNWMSQE